MTQSLSLYEYKEHDSMSGSRAWRKNPRQKIFKDTLVICVWQNQYDNGTFARARNSIIITQLTITICNPVAMEKTLSFEIIKADLGFNTWDSFQILLQANTL